MFMWELSPLSPTVHPLADPNKILKINLSNAHQKSSEISLSFLPAVCLFGKKK